MSSVKQSILVLSLIVALASANHEYIPAGNTNQQQPIEAISPQPQYAPVPAEVGYAPQVMVAAQQYEQNKARYPVAEAKANNIGLGRTDDIRSESLELSGIDDIEDDLSSESSKDSDSASSTLAVSATFVYTIVAASLAGMMAM
ncbi:hypothetical protein GGI07_000941 [Coemansia sp. Benny D115]|nr:hypothetical protein GGI07_000941 [Coemansia sp. Benny D115]